MSNSNDPKDPPEPPADLFPFDEMSTGEASSLLRRANQVTGKPQNPPPVPKREELKPMTGAQLAFRPSAPPRQPGGTGSFAPLKPQSGSQPAHKPGQTGTQAAYKPTTGTQPAFKPTGQTGTTPAFTPTSGRPATGTTPAFTPSGRPATGTTPAFRPGSGNHPAVKPATGTQPAYRPTPPAARPPDEPHEREEAPVFDVERLQAQIRSLSLTDSALGRTPGKVRPSKTPTTAAEDTFVKSKMKEAEAKVPDFSLDDDLG